MSELDDIVREFLVESAENLDQLDQAFVALEHEPDDRTRLASIFRTIHTIKGTCGFLGFSKLESLTHVGESLLSKLRDGHLRLKPEITTALLSLVDAVREMLSAIEKTGADGDKDYQELAAELARLQQANQEAAKQQKTESAEERKPQNAPEVKPQTESVPPQEAVKQEAKEEPAEEKKVVQESADGPAKSTSISDTTIRVDVQLLDKLMNLVGELVLTRNQVVQSGSRFEDASFTAALQRLNLITSELQEGVMKTRMQPIANAWNRFPRLVRDLSRSCLKQIRLEMEGKETELDKSLVEAISDPLTHMVRNAVDHGIEPPDIRVAAGKPAEGLVLLRAYHEGGQVNIEIVDDGAGIDRDRVKKKALERGLITEEQARQMSDSEVTNLLFMPGFSTAEKITNVSGRGVGMDVVKTNIERIGGTVEIQSKKGEGSTVKVRIPLTLAIVPALIVRAAGERFAIPQMSLLELVRLEGDHASAGIEFIGGAPVHRLRGNLLPLVCLRKVLQMGHGVDSGNCVECISKRGALNIVVVAANGRQFGLVVDRIDDSQEIVVKPLGKLLHSLNVFAGLTILGDGKVALILDVAGLAQQSGIHSKGADSQLEHRAAAASESSERHQLLISGSNEHGWFAVPLGQVTRLEKIPLSSVEHIGDRCVVRYRGEIMPLIDVSATLGGRSELSEAVDGEVDVVVYTAQRRTVGFVVERITDIIEDTLSVQSKATREGVLCTVAAADRVVEVLDLNKVIILADPEFFKKGSRE